MVVITEPGTGDPHSMLYAAFYLSRATKQKSGNLIAALVQRATSCSPGIVQTSKKKKKNLKGFVQNKTCVKYYLELLTVGLGAEAGHQCRALR